MGIKIDHIQKKKSTFSASKAENFLHKDITLFTKLGDKKKHAFYSQLSILLKSGVDVRLALEIMTDEQSKSEHLTKLNKSIVQGATFSDALKNIKGISTYEIQSVKIGEETGKLAIVLEELSSYFRDKLDLTSQMVNLLIYPVIVLLLALSVTYFMLLEVVPMFEEIFRSFGAELPAITKLIIKFSHILRGNILIISLIFVGVIAFFLYSKNKSWFRKISSDILLRTPVVNVLIRKVYLARFTRSMHLLISSDVTLNRAVILVEKMIGLYPMEIALKKVSEDLLKGVAFNASLSKFNLIFEKKFCSMIRVSEELNQMSTMFDTLSKQYKAEVNSQSDLIGKITEPFLIILIALFVGFILVAMYMPLFEIGNTIS